MSRELATIHVRYIPANADDFHLDDSDYIKIDDEIQPVKYNSDVISDAAMFDVDLIGIKLQTIGLQSCEHEQENSILWYLYNEGGAEETYDIDAAEWLIETAAKLRKDDNPFVSFVVAFNCDVEPDTDNWTGYTHGEPYAELTHYCNAETLEWIEVGK